MSNPEWRREVLAMSTTELGQRNGEGLLALQLQAALRDEVDAAARLAEVEAERDALAAKVEAMRALPVGPPSGGFFMISMREVRQALDGTETDHA